MDEDRGSLDLCPSGPAHRQRLGPSESLERREREGEKGGIWGGVGPAHTTPDTPSHSVPGLFQHPPYHSWLA